MVWFGTAEYGVYSIMSSFLNTTPEKHWPTAYYVTLVSCPRSKHTLVNVFVTGILPQVLPLTLQHPTLTIL